MHLDCSVRFDSCWDLVLLELYSNAFYVQLKLLISDKKGKFNSWLICIMLRCTLKPLN